MIFIHQGLFYPGHTVSVLSSQFTHDNPKSQKYLLGGFEQLVGVKYKESLLAKVPLILKALYDLDIIDEEVIIDWGTKVR